MTARAQPQGRHRRSRRQGQARHGERHEGLELRRLGGDAVPEVLKDSVALPGSRPSGLALRRRQPPPALGLQRATSALRENVAVLHVDDPLEIAIPKLMKAGRRDEVVSAPASPRYLQGGASSAEPSVTSRLRERMAARRRQAAVGHGEDQRARSRSRGDPTPSPSSRAAVKKPEPTRARRARSSRPTSSRSARSSRRTSGARTPRRAAHGQRRRSPTSSETACGSRPPQDARERPSSRPEARAPCDGARTRSTTTPPAPLLSPCRGGEQLHP